jgi:ribonuclease HI
MEEVLTLEFDGGSRGNPGPAGIGVVVRAADGTPLVTLGRFIGRTTNNVAEYQALVTALKKARELGARRVAVRGDSELVVKQMRGEYRVKNEGLKGLYQEAQDLLAQFEQATISHNYRHKNALADKLANLAMDRKADVTDVNGEAAAGATGAGGVTTPSPLDAPSPVAPKQSDRFACPRCGCVIRIEKPTGVRPHQLKPFSCQCGFKMQQVDKD